MVAPDGHFAVEDVDLAVDIADAIFTLAYLFGAGAELPCADAADANDDEALDIADAIAILAHLFGGQGTINVPSWSPDSKHVAFVSYRLVARTQESL